MHDLHFHSDCVLCVVVSIICSYSLASNIPNICLLYCVIILYSDEQSEGEYNSLSSQLLLHPCMDLNETWQGCCTKSLEVHVGR